MRKFASPINSAPLPIDDITLSLPPIAQATQMAIGPVTPVTSSFDSLICFNPLIEGTEILVEIGGEFFWYELTALVGGVGLTSTDVVWNYSWSNPEVSSPYPKIESGFSVVIGLDTVAGAGAYTITATIGSVSRSLILNVVFL